MSGTPALGCKAKDATRAIALPIAVTGVAVIALDHIVGIIHAIIIGLCGIGGLVLGLAWAWWYVTQKRPANRAAAALERATARTIDVPRLPERLYRPAPAQPAITPPEVHNHLHIDAEAAERLFRRPA